MPRTTPSPDFEQYLAKARGGLPRAAQEWLAPAREAMERLTKAAVDPSVSDSDFLAMVEKQSEEIPELMAGLGTVQLAQFFEAAMGAAMAGGIEEVIVEVEKANSKAQPPEVG